MRQTFTMRSVAMTRAAVPPLLGSLAQVQEEMDMNVSTDGGAVH